MTDLTKDSLQEAVRQIESIIRKIQAIDIDRLPQAQKTLIERRMAALHISLRLINRELDGIKD